MNSLRSILAGNLAYSLSKSYKGKRTFVSIPSIIWTDDCNKRARVNKSIIKSGAAVVKLGSMRRVTLKKSKLSTNEIYDLACRINILGRNQSLSSIVITNHRSVQDFMLPYILDINNSYKENKNTHRISPIRGYDHKSLFRMSSVQRQQILLGLSLLAAAVNGNLKKESTNGCHLKEESLSLAPRLHRISSSYNDPPSPSSYIPTISIPHGHTYDGGYALLMSTYVLATSSSSYQIQNPSKGLAFDPIGLSYILPRLGQEHNQPSSHYPVGKVLALTGYQANGNDMVETGLATHYLDNMTKLDLLEESLREMRSWNQHQLLPSSSKKIYRRPNTLRTNNYLSVAVSNLLYSSCTYGSSGQEIDPNDKEFQFGLYDDPSIHFGEHSTCYYGQRSSHLLDIAATFSSIWNERNLVDIIKKLRQIEHIESNDKVVKVTAKSLADQMESYCPLALLAINKVERNICRKVN